MAPKAILRLWYGFSSFVERDFEMLKFNHRGFLVPNNNISSTLEELKSVFVDQLSNNKRIELYEKYIRYSNELKALVGDIEIKQWIDGSFVTKKPDPGDIDMVTFIDGNVITQLEGRLEPFKNPGSITNYDVDAYIVPIYDRDDKKYPLYIANRLHWMYDFDKTKRSRTGERHPKGFLEIIY